METSVGDGPADGSGGCRFLVAAHGGQNHGRNRRVARNQLGSGQTSGVSRGPETAPRDGPAAGEAMKHLSDEELYALSQSPGGGLPNHLRGCRECSTRFHEFVALLESAAGAAGTPRPASDLTDRVWAAIRPSLPIYHPQKQGRRTSGVFTAWWPRGLVWAGALASLVFIGTIFWAGRLFERRHTETNLAMQAPPSQPGRVVLLV